MATQTPNIQHKVQFMIDHWHHMSSTEIAKEIGISPNLLAHWAKKVRARGIDLPKKQRLSDINWKALLPSQTRDYRNQVMRILLKYGVKEEQLNSILDELSKVAISNRAIPLKTKELNTYRCDNGHVFNTYLEINDAYCPFRGCKRHEQLEVI